MALSRSSPEAPGSVPPRPTSSPRTASTSSPAVDDPSPSKATAAAIRAAYPQVSARAVVMDVTDAASVAAAAR